jgi:hypothetical protein
MGEAEQIAEDIAKVAAAESKITSAGKTAVSDVNKWRHQLDRSFIVRAVVWLYVVVIGALMIFFAVKGASGDDNATSYLLDLLKVGVLPVVTLVIGYYFGSAKSE